MLTVESIKSPIAEEMQTFESRFKDAMKSSTPLLDKITHYIIRRKGKQMRPMFVFLAAKATGKVTDSSYTAASLIELLHTATLVHDDVVDDANMRRGFFSINALWKNKIAVLVGDYLLSQGLLMSIDNNEFQLLKIVSKAVREMSEGELLQIEKARKLNITEEVYYDIIRQKTASLISACCESGAASAGATEEVQVQMGLFGQYVGMAFQIKDDLFDYGNGEGIGKPTGIDIKERKLTLPLIYALQHAENSDRRRLIGIIKNHNENPRKVKEVVEYVIQSGGIEYSIEKMHELKNKAVALLQPLPESDSKAALLGLVEYTINRKK
ncbi:MAG: polyprenyl synthetase family protein [Flavobacteriales bacterium]|nr:polyprenyl synthetase family protein [Flavobacteriales bacterium]